MKSVVPEDLRDLFLAAGWTAERTCAKSHAHPMEATYSELGGLSVGVNGPGVECATADVVFDAAPVRDSSVAEWESLLRTELFRLGVSSGGHEMIFLAIDGRVFGFSEINDTFYMYGQTVKEGLERLFHGLRARPLLRPKDNSVTLYGHRYTRDHPDVYHYAERA